MKSKLILLLYSVILFVTPLLFTTVTKESFEFPKMFFVYLIGSTLIFIMILQKIVGESSTPNRISKWILLFVIGNIISTVFSMHFYTSLWGYYSRFNESLISVLVFFGLYVVAKNYFDKNDFKKLLDISLVAVFPVGLYGIVQHFQLLNNLNNMSTNVRVYSTIGQPNWLAAYMVTLLPIIFVYAINSNNEKRDFWFLTYIFGFGTLWLTYSVSGILGFTVGMGLAGLLNMQMLKKNYQRALLIVLFSIGFVILRPGIFVERIQDVITEVKKTVHIQRIAYAMEEQEDFKYNVSDPGAIRKYLWKGTIDLIFSSPKNLLIGTGPETFPYAFQKFRPLELNYTSEWDYIFNKPHNYYLEVLAETGLLGFAPYVVILFYTLKKRDALLTPGLVAFYVTNIFGWPTVATTLLFWFFLAKLDISE